MKFRDIRSVDEYCGWLQDKGFSPGENANVSLVYPVHTSTSLHYKIVRGGRVVDGPIKNVTYKGRPIPTRQGRLAVDINDNDVDDDHLPFDSEHEALAWLYRKTLEVARRLDWPLDEMFFNGFGFIRERGYEHNHPITGHDHHMHIGFYAEVW